MELAWYHHSPSLTTLCQSYGISASLTRLPEALSMFKPHLEVLFLRPAAHCGRLNGMKKKAVCILVILVLMSACSEDTEDVREADLAGRGIEAIKEVRAEVSRVMQDFAQGEFETDGISRLMHGPSFKDRRG